MYEYSVFDVYTCCTQLLFRQSRYKSCTQVVHKCD